MDARLTRPRLPVAILEPPHSLVLSSDDGNGVGAFASAAALDGSRLISRNGIKVPSGSPLIRALYKYLVEAGSLVMGRKMLLGIRQRAENLRA